MFNKLRDRARRFIVIALGLVLPLLATQAHTEERRWYSAHDSLRRAQVGTSSPRLAAPVRVKIEPRTSTARYERMECRPDPSRPLERVIICRHVR